MKRLIIIHGTMGVGKTTAAKALCHRLPRAGWLDGDWCWTYRPECNNTETRAMVLDNIIHILRNYLKSTTYDTVILSWVIHQQSILDAILQGLEDLAFELKVITLMASEEALKEHFVKDGRDPAAAEASVARLPLYESMDTQKIDVSGSTPEETLKKIMNELFGDGNAV